MADLTLAEIKAQLKEITQQRKNYQSEQTNLATQLAQKQARQGVVEALLSSLDDQEKAFNAALAALPVPAAAASSAATQGTPTPAPVAAPVPAPAPAPVESPAPAK